MGPTGSRAPTRRARCATALLVLLCSLAWSAVARAACVSAQPDAGPRNEEEVKALEAQANRAYSDKDYAAALRALSSAYRAQPKPWHLHNLGYAHDRSGARAQAVECFEEFLRTAADAPPEIRAKVSGRLRELREPPPKPVTAALPVGAVTLAPLVPPAPPKQKLELHKRWWFWTIVGVTSAGAVAGITAGVLLNQHRSGATPAPCTMNCVMF